MKVLKVLLALLTTLAVALTAALLDTQLYAATGQLLDLFSWPAIALAAVLWLLMKKVGGHPIIYLAASAVVGIIFKF